MSVIQDRRFFPLFATQFFGAFNDNFLKNALILLVTLNPGIVGGVERSDIWINIFSAVFIAPYFLFSITAGQLSDKFPRDRIARFTKVWEIVLMVLAGFAFYIRSPYPMMIILFMMGMQSTFFSPAKYSILPQLLNEKELVNANALLEAGTYLAIITGTLGGSILMRYSFGKPLVWSLLMVFAVIGYLTSRAIPKLDPVAPDLRLDKNPVRGILQIIGEAARLPEVFFAIITGSWFWILGIVLLAQIPSLCKNILHIETAIPVFFMLFTIGIGIGTLLASRLMRGIVQTTPVPFALLLMVLFLLPLADNFEVFSASHPESSGISSLFHDPTGWKIMLSMLGVAVACGIFIVPLNTLIQYASPKEQVARMIAANNIVNAIAMAAGSLSVAALLKWGFPITDIIRYTGAASLVVLIALVIVRPEDVLRGIFQLALTLLFRVRINGYEHFESAGGRTIIISNHVSLLDGVLLAAFIPVRLGFAISTEWAKKWFIRALRPFINFFPVSSNRSLALAEIVARVKKGQPCIFFPEGKITTTGGLSEIQPGAALAASRSGAVLVPAAIIGANRTYFSYLKNRRLFPKITIDILPALPYRNETREERMKQIEEAMRNIQSRAEGA